MAVSCVIRTLVTDYVIHYLVSKTWIGFWCSLGNQWHFLQIKTLMGQDWCVRRKRKRTGSGCCPCGPGLRVFPSR